MKENLKEKSKSKKRWWIVSILIIFIIIILFVIHASLIYYNEKKFPDLLATFSTNYDTSVTNKIINMELASNKINGTVLMPGEEFSFNDVVGKRTSEAGYKEYEVVENEKVVLGIGGGICQVSTTLYNAVIESNLEVTSRKNHTYLPPYITEGRDATVDWGTIDFKFKNSREYPIKIESSVSNGIMKISIYGVYTNDEYDSIEIEAKTAEFEKKKHVVDIFKIYKKDGEIVKEEFISKDTYKRH